MPSKALIIEDSPELLLSLDAFLRSRGFEVKSCSWYGMPTIDPHGSYDLAVIDMDREAPASAGIASCPLDRISTPIFVFGFSAGWEVAQAMTLARARLLFKPFTETQMLNVLSATEHSETMRSLPATKYIGHSM